MIHQTVQQGQNLETSADSADELTSLPISLIEEDPANERKQFTNLEELARSIEHVGIVEPITVREVQGHYQIIAGHRRFRAAKLLGLREVPAVVVSSSDDTAVRFRSLASNIQREALNPVEVAAALKHLLITKQAKSQRCLSKLIGKDETWVSGMLRIAEMPESALVTLRDSPVPISYDCAIRIARVTDKDQQADLTNQLVTGATVRQIRAAIRKARTSWRVDSGSKNKNKNEWSVVSPHGHVATVSGPDDNPERLLEAVALLVKKLRNDHASNAN